MDQITCAPTARWGMTDPTTRITLATAFATQLNRYTSEKLDAAQTLALDVATFDSKIAKYEATIFDCKCPDHAYRHVTCKHMIAQMLVSGLFL
jgi:hypothetical protein